MEMVTVFWALLSKPSAQLNPFIVTLCLLTQFHFLISQFNTVPQHRNRRLLLYSLPLSSSSKHSPPKHSWKLTLNLCLRGFFFRRPIFHFCGLLFASAYSEMCAVDRNTFGKAVPRNTPLLSFIQGCPGFMCSGTYCGGICLTRQWWSSNVLGVLVDSYR